jgi:hypothetical protein
VAARAVRIRDRAGGAILRILLRETFTRTK